MKRRSFLASAAMATVGLAGCSNVPELMDNYGVEIDDGSFIAGRESLIESVVLYDGGYFNPDFARLTFGEYESDFQIHVSETDAPALSTSEETYYVVSGTREADIEPPGGVFDLPITFTATSLDGRTLGVARCVRYDGRITPRGESA